MRRFQLFEILDQPWCPGVLRDGATDALEAMTDATDLYRPVRDRMLDAIDRCGANRIVDLCSGGGGPWLSRPWSALLENSSDLSVTLTDKFPSRALQVRLEHGLRVRAVDSPVDATEVPETLRGFRTIFSSFHHFSDAMATKILNDAVRSHEGFASAEVTSRSPRAMLTMLFLPLLVWRLTPRMRPFRWSRLLFTYLVPAIPLLILWDGMISCLRTRTPEELLALAGKFPEYGWTAGYAGGDGVWLAPVYLIGWPQESLDKPIAAMRG